MISEQMWIDKVDARRRLEDSDPQCLLVSSDQPVEALTMRTLRIDDSRMDLSSGLLTREG